MATPRKKSTTPTIIDKLKSYGYVDDVSGQHIFGTLAKLVQSPESADWKSFQQITNNVATLRALCTAVLQHRDSLFDTAEGYGWEIPEGVVRFRKKGSGRPKKNAEPKASKFDSIEL